jgi:hypothetical protein
MDWKKMFGWSNPKDTYGNAVGLAHGAASQHSTATNAAHNPYSGYQNIASTSTANQAALAQMNAYQQTYMQAQAKVQEPKVNLNEGAWTVPISQLVDLWIVKFGSKWVDHEDLADDDFYQVALVRLEKLGKVETHHLQDRYMPVYKIVE